MIHLTGELPRTAHYSRREYTVLAGLTWTDGRQCSVWLNHFTAKSRLGRRSQVSSYAVAEVPEVGFMGRTFVWNKEAGEDEHGEARPGDRKPPYCVRIDGHGEIWCQCMAASCDAPTCRHCDMTLVLIEEGVFDEVLCGV